LFRKDVIFIKGFPSGIQLKSGKIVGNHEKY